MKTVKEILTENRDSVISSIKYVFKIFKHEDIKAKMIDFLIFAQENADVHSLTESTRVKTDLKILVQKMAISQKPKTDKRKWYEIKEDIADELGLVVNSRTGNFQDVYGNIVNIENI